jgi:hypothetical protein
MFEDLDELARGLAENDISRRQALRWAGYSVLGAALSSVGFAESAEALGSRAWRRCRRKGGTPLEKGQCHCAYKCGADPARFACENNPSCACLRTTEGRGFCADVSGGCIPCQGGCPSGTRCVIPKPISGLRNCCRTLFLTRDPIPVCAPACPPTTSSTQQDAASRVTRKEE